MKDRTSDIFTGFRLGLAALGLVGMIMAVPFRVGSAQTGSGSPPPSYDYNDAEPGVQGPTSPLMAGAEARSLQTFLVQITILVPLAEIQAVLPPGFIARPNPAGSNMAQVGLLFLFQQRTTSLSDGKTFGPGSGLRIQTGVINTNLMPNRQEQGFLVQEWSSQELVDYQNAVFGPGASRLANVNAQIVEDGGNLSFKFTVTDPGIGLNVSAEATCPGPIVTRSKNDPQSQPFRFLIPQRSAWAATQSDLRSSIPQAMANVKVDVPGGKLQVPTADGGSRSLTISGMGATANFWRNNEYITKLE
ncbi:MAG: hypothetical protein HY650_02605 [Acidobacteria bacterium]|nr:hypothetical protein [Acidobacteriota bacterium]